MELPLSQPYFWALLLLVVSNLLLWEKAASIPACQANEGGCWDPLVETFNSAIQRAETLQKLSNQFYVELYHNQFSAGQFADFNSQLIWRDKAVVRAATYCHSTLTNPPNWGTEHADIEVEDYLKTSINYVGSWISPLFHLVIELSAMKDVPETILTKAKEIEENNRKILDDLRWILTQVYPTAEMKEEFPSWEHLSFLKSSGKYDKFLAMFNLFNCLEHDTKFTLFHLRILKCRITGKDC
ncbi:prolactin-8A8-like isoform X2 [Arvicanthis niloticus]|uniref:prolactin-8A8-like isoform X2 n=1 Tax=Arvicanthis niloticus TaxID=61156 RepID=UPI0014872851|nr:prolactin-8A8-like isoform X2 [Arvicanthis niloticus]